MALGADTQNGAGSAVLRAGESETDMSDSAGSATVADDTASSHRFVAANTQSEVAPGYFRLPLRKRSLPRKKAPRVVLLQGPVGPFFKHLQRFLDRNGFDTWRITFSAADGLFSDRGKRLSFHGGRKEWEIWLRGFLSTADVDYLVLFGAEREIHAVARREAEAFGVEVISLEEGYLRPGFVTIERGANNWLSPIARQLPPKDFDPAEAGADSKTFPNSFRTMCLHGLTYYAVRSLFTGIRRRKLFHRPIRPMTEVIGWTRNAYRRFAHSLSNFSTVERLLEHHDKRYFLVPLQVSADTQLGRAALGWSNARLIMETLHSFAATAPRKHRLVFKIHPLERGHSNDRHLAFQVARMLGVEKRVDVIDTGSLGLLTRHCAGMITINSTSGLSAIYHGVPLMVIGQAFYANEALATCARGNPDFEAFWTKGHVADAQLRQTYLAWLRKVSLRAGDFYVREGMELACQGVLDTIQATKVVRFDAARKSC